MANKALVLYASATGNTEKVAMRFKQTFEINGWQCDLIKVDKNIVANPPLKYEDYDFLCVGSYVWMSQPSKEILHVLRPGLEDLSASEPNPEEVQNMSEEQDRQGHKRIIPGNRKGIVFVTYAGAHLGPKEAEPSLSLLDMEMEHLGPFRCVGRFSCPGRMVKHPTPYYWHGDISKRPDERDLMKAEIFLREKIEEPLG